MPHHDQLVIHRAGGSTFLSPRDFVLVNLTGRDVRKTDVAKYRFQVLSQPLSLSWDRGALLIAEFSYLYVK